MNELMKKLEKTVSEVSDYFKIEYDPEYETIVVKTFDNPELLNGLAEKFAKMPEYQGNLSLVPEVDENYNELVLFPSTMYLEDLDESRYCITD